MEEGFKNYVLVTLDIISEIASNTLIYQHPKVTKDSVE